MEDVPHFDEGFLCKNGTRVHAAPGKVVVIQELPPDRTAAGLIIPDTAKKKSVGRGRVISLGAPLPLIHPDHRPLPEIGDLVVFELGMERALEEGDQLFTVVEPKYLYLILRRAVEALPGEPSPGFFRRAANTDG